MTIDFSNKEYETLVKLLFIGNLIVNGYKTSLDEWEKDVKDILEKVFCRYKDYNADDLIVYIKELDRHFVGREKEAEYMQIVEEYEADCFEEENDL